MAEQRRAQKPAKRRRAKYILNPDRITQLSEDERRKLKEVSKRYVFRANDYYLSLIDWDNPDDPIRRPTRLPARSVIRTRTFRRISSGMHCTWSA